MKSLKLVLFLSLLFSTGYAQLVVDGHNINQQDTVQYIQLSFFYSGKDMLPIYAVDYGGLLVDADQKQNITVDGDTLSNKMTPMNVLNKLYHSGWEYVGDAVFMRAPIVENTQTFTLRRRRSD